MKTGLQFWEIGCRGSRHCSIGNRLVRFMRHRTAFDFCNNYVAASIILMCMFRLGPSICQYYPELLQAAKYNT
jgi:hypothetical protein